MEEKQIVIKDLLVNYYHTGGKETNGMAVILFLHGWRADGKVWIPVIRSLAEKDFQIYALDLPGFGKTLIRNDNLGLADYCDVVREFIQKLGLSAVCLVGHSFGGKIAIKLAADYPGLIHKLILVDSAGIKAEPKFKTLKKIIAKVLKPLFQLRFMQPLRLKLYQKIGAEDYVATPKLTRTFLNIVREDSTESMPKITAPTLIIWGENDQETPLEQGRKINSLISNSKFLILSRAGHYSFLDKTGQFTKELEKFLKG